MTHSDSADGCDGSNGGLADWNIDYNPTKNLKGLFMHEMGHVLGLVDLYSSGVVNPTLLPGGQYSYSIMGNGGFDETHLAPYDRDCVDDYLGFNLKKVNGVPIGVTPVTHRAPRRNIRYVYQGFDQNNIKIGGLVYDNTGNNVKKGFISGGSLKDLDGSNYYSRFYYDRLYTSFVGVDGYFTWLAQNPYHSSYQNIEINTYNRPLLMTPYERSTERQRISYLKMEMTKPTNNDFTLIDPPFVKSIKSNSYFNINSSNSENYKQCQDLVCNSSFTDIKSSLPLISAWDPVSLKTIFYYVDTPINNVGLHGKIYILPGFFDSLTNRLNPANALEPNNQNLPPIVLENNANNLQYKLRTDTPVGLACHPNVNKFPFNCLLAWNERSTGEGSILYTYFKVNGSSIDWLGSVYSMYSPSLKTVSGVSVAYFNDRLWLAVKTLYGDISYVYIQEHYEDWPTHVSSINTFQKVIDPPTWQHHPLTNRESALIWTEFND